MEHKEHKDTRVHLVEELLRLEPTAEVLELLAEARSGEYHDYKNEKYVCGKTEAVRKLRNASDRTSSLADKAKLIELSERVVEGEFDEQADAQDVADMQKTLPKEMWPLLGL
jgi:hypothetical protein